MTEDPEKSLSENGVRTVKVRMDMWLGNLTTY
jgi:hypothetical protein